MTTNERELLYFSLEKLKGLTGAEGRDLSLLATHQVYHPDYSDGTIEIKMGKNKHLFDVMLKNQVRDNIPSYLLQPDHKGSKNDTLLVSRYIAKPLKEELKEHQINYLEAAGNCFIKTDNLYIYINDQPVTDVRLPADGKLWKTAGIKFLFSILSNPELLNQNYRAIASASTIALGNIGPLMAELQKEGYVKEGVREKAKFLFIDKKDQLIRRWAEAYRGTLIKNWTTIPAYRLNVNVFKFISLNTGSLTHKNYCYHDLNDLSNSIFLVSFSDSNSLAKYLNENVISEILSLYVLSNINTSLNISGGAFILIKRQRVYNPKQVLAFLKFQMLMDGMYTHQPYEVIRTPSVFNRKRIKVTSNYHQFGDTLMILSEYNYQKDLIDKYLRLYHVLENNMYRTQIVKVERTSLGGVFSIRDFQHLYKSLKESESVVLKQLFSEAFTLQYSATQTFGQFVLAQFVHCKGLMGEPAIDGLFSVFRINKKIPATYTAAGIAAGNILDFYTLIVYTFRNSMVHNRETEFHLMHETLSAPIKEFIQEFLIPTIEEMIILLTIERNNIIWYSNSYISVYQE